MILALVKNPEVQRKAQAEIDTVVGDARLPNFDDRKSMPYVEAIYRELIRWAPAAPMGEWRVVPLGDHLVRHFQSDVLALSGVPHAASEDDLYNGFLIPKGMCLFMTLVFLPLREYRDRDDCATQYMVRFPLKLLVSVSY